MSREHNVDLTDCIRPARTDDVAGIVALVRDFYAEDEYPFDEARTAEAVARLVREEGLGRIWVAEPDAGLAGYIALTLGFSLEYMGRDGFVDDLYVRPEWRTKGLGTALLEALLAKARDLGVQALHLEVARDKRGAQELYRSAGFEDHDRMLMTRGLTT